MSDSEFLVRETAHLGVEQLAEATNATFAGYFTPISHTPAGFAAFCRWYSVDLAHSVLLEHTDGRFAGLTMLAQRGPQGWCGGFGIVPEFRGWGLSSVLVNALMGRACSLSLAAFRLEVMRQNARAIKTYERAGFETLRDLVILSGDLRPDPPDASVEIQAATPAAAWYAGLGLPGPAPCWQREVVSLLSMDAIRGLIALRTGQVAGVLLFRGGTPPSPLAVGHLAFADEAAGHALLVHAALETGLKSLFVLNEPENGPSHRLFQALGLREIHRQHEMIVAL